MASVPNLKVDINVTTGIYDEILFIGGCADGERYRTNGRPFVDVPRFPINKLARGKVCNVHEAVIVDTYRKEGVICNNKIF